MKGYAKKIVPESITMDFEEAMDILQKTFGDPIKLMKYRTGLLAKLGDLPRENNKKGFKGIVEWYIEIESLMRNMLVLGRQDTQLGMIIFQPLFISKVYNKFPTSIMNKIIGCEGTADVHFENVLYKITKWRESAQKVLLAKEADDSHDDQGGGGRGRGDRERDRDREGQGSQGFRGKGSYLTRSEKKKGKVIDEPLPNLISYKPPIRDEQCRICKTLEVNGDTKDLYDNHFSNFPTGCPRFVAMTVNRRYFVSIQAKLCVQCQDPDYIHKKNDRDHKCSVANSQKKRRWTCTAASCVIHMWCCTRHKDQNMKSLKMFEDEWKSKYNLEFGYCVSIPISPAKNTTKETVTSSIPGGGKLKVKKKDVISEKKTGIKQVSNSSETAAACKHRKNSLSSDQAMDKLKRNLSAEGVVDELQPVAKGAPQFMIGYSQGKTRPLMTLYDTGCGSVLFRDGVPQQELSGSVLKTKGPFTVKGVGDTSVTVMDEYMCTMGLVDSRRQVLEGWTVRKITATLPYVNISLAESELKSSSKENQELQNLTCQPVAGGDCDVLLGIMYSSIFPERVHSLENGLTIYSLKLTPHDNNFNAVIGGPHESFQFFAQEFGGLSLVFAHLTQQMQAFKKHGPPKIKAPLMTVEEMEFAQNNKDWGIENFEETLDEFNLLPESDLLSVSKEPEQIQYADGKVLVCSGCGVELSEEAAATIGLIETSLATRTGDDDEDLKAYKDLQKAVNEGLNIDYRCPRCRNCNDCRRSFETERVSLREEAEDLQIWESVVIDWKKKQIICHLPTRGKEEDFLSNNRDMALKVLDQQCYKYQNNKETKDTIVKAFKKLMKNGQMVLWKDLSEEQKKIIEEKAVNHYIVWRVVFKLSLSTPARPVFDGSQRTKPRPDGTGGRCLNDLVVKGRVTTLNLVKMVLRFSCGKYAVQGDLKQFYASIKLWADQWNLQRVLYREDLDPNGELQEAVIQTLIWGIKSVSAQSECAIMKLAESIKDKFPMLAEFLTNSRFVDDLGDSAAELETLKKLTEQADKVFEEVGLACKGWSFSGSSPPTEVCEEGETISIGGARWHTKLDLLEIPIPPLHFSKKVRGRLEVGTEVFEGSFGDLEKFVPAKLTRRMIFSKNHSVFDITGKLVPVLAGMKLDLRQTAKLTDGWDSAVPEELRSKWIKHFWRLETLKGMKFERARMPLNAVSTQMDMIVAADAAEWIKIVGAWVRFRLDTGKFSCQLLIGRSLLAEETGTIPKNELDALTMGSNLSWILRQGLEKWISSHILIGDSTISLCWVTSEKKRLSLYHRNRCVQIRRGVELDQLYHVVSEANPADCGTRPSAVKEDHVGPNSIWEKGLPWMKDEVDEAVANGILTPVANLRVNEEQEEDYNDGLVFEKSQEILTRGHQTSALISRTDRVKSRAEVAGYLLLPTKFKFVKVVRIYAIVFRFLKSFKCLRKKFVIQESKPLKTKFQMFLNINCIKSKLNSYEEEEVAVTECRINAITAVIRLSEGVEHQKVFNVFDEDYVEIVKKDSNEEVVDVHRLAAFGVGVKKPGLQFKGKFHVILTDGDMSLALEYLFRKESEVVKKFNKPELLMKISVEKDGILMSKTRILDGQRFQLAGGLENQNILAEYNMKLMTPVLDRFSSLSYSIADYIHTNIAKHAGYETSYRECLEHCFIIQGLGLFREIGEDCSRCAMKRKRFIDVSMGPISDEQLTIAPAFYITMCDIFGPCHVFVPGHAMKTRHRNIVEVKCYVLVFCCPVTKMVNLQVIEDKSADGVLDGVNRLGCEVGFPSFLLVDQDSGILKALKEADVEVRNLQFVLQKERSIKFKTCPVSGHNFHGLVERKIRTVQECLEESQFAKMKYHATGLQTVLKLVENDINNLPLGYAYGRDGDNSPLLRLIFPNMLKIGRLNSRALDGPVRMPKNPGELMEKIEKGYSAFFKVWNTSMVPKLMKQNKWFDNKSELQVDDIVYFRKVENELSSKWTVGKIVRVVKSRDGLVRRAFVQYQNSTEDFPRETDRAARSLIKIFNIDDQTWQSDMSKVERLMKVLEKDEKIENVAETVIEEPFEDNLLGFVKNPVEDGLKVRFTPVFQQSTIPGLEKASGSKSIQGEIGDKLSEWLVKKKSCKSCCCQFHCVLAEHGLVYEQEFPTQQVLYAGLLDKSWAGPDDYLEDVRDMGGVGDPFLSMLCALDTNLSEVSDATEETVEEMLLSPGLDTLLV